MSTLSFSQDAARYYSMRRLSPYLGTVQVVDMPSFCAMSADGLTWELRIDNPGMRPTRALWRENGVNDVTVTKHTQAFIAALHDRPLLPFALADTVELWLLDARGALPLALLASTLPHMTPPSTVDAVWRAGFAEDESFISTSLQAAVEDPPAQPIMSHREILDRCVRKTAGARAKAQWFQRDVNGDGVGLRAHDIAPSWIGRKIDASQFPELLLRERWESEIETNLVKDYHDWLAPALLTHNNLRRATRERLEKVACGQAEKLYSLRHLLPEIINHELVDVALVEAMLRRASATETR